MMFSSSITTTQHLFNLFLALFTLQQASTALALPTRGSYGQLARRANAAKNTPAARAARSARASAAFKQQQEPILLKRGEAVVVSNTASPVSHTFATPTAHVIQVNPKLALKQKSTTHGLAASRNATAVVSSSSSSADKEEEEEASAVNAAKAASLGGGYSMFAAANGVPSPSASSSSSPSWVSASNVTLPSNIGVAKRSSVSPEKSSKQHLKKRVVPHPGEPSATIKVNVVGGDTYQNFTIIASETGKSSASSTKTSTSIKTAQTGINVNIVHSGTGSAVNEDAEEEDETLLTFTFILPLDVLAASTLNDTITLVPAGNDSYIPYINNKKVSSLTTENNDDNDDNHKATCTVPVDDEVLLAVARGQTFFSSCVTVDAVAKKIRVKVDVSIVASPSSDEDESDSNSKTKRQTIAYFQSPAFKNEKLNKRQMVAFFKAPDHGPEVLPPSSSAQEEEIVQSTVSYTKEEMMSDLWEDCVVGVDEGCLEIPEQ